MSDFVFLYRGYETPANPDEAQKMTQKWMSWIMGLNEKGHVKSFGARLDKSGSVVKGRPGAITDGPFAEVKDVIGGFTLIQAKDLDQATELSKGCPGFERGGYVEVRPVREM